MGQQHLADRAARLLQLGEIGVLLGDVARARSMSTGHQQGGGLGQAHGEPQQPGMFGAESPRAIGSTSANRPIRAAHSDAALAAHATAVSSAVGEASTSSAICRARCGLPAFIAKVAASASIVVCAAGSVSRLRVFCRNAVACSGCAEHPELVGRPRQCPRDQFRLGQRAGVHGRQHRVGLAATALPGQRLTQQQPRRPGRRRAPAPPGQPFGQRQIAQPQRLLARPPRSVDRLRGVAVRGPVPPPATGRWRAPGAGREPAAAARLRSRRAPSSPRAARARSANNGCAV